MGSATILGIAIPNITTVFSIVGASSSVLVSFILPCAFYLHIRTGKIVSYDEPLASLVFVGGCAFGVVATIATIVASLYPHLLEVGDEG